MQIIDHVTFMIFATHKSEGLATGKYVTRLVGLSRSTLYQLKKKKKTVRKVNFLGHDLVALFTTKLICCLIDKGCKKKASKLTCS